MSTTTDHTTSYLSPLRLTFAVLTGLIFLILLCWVPVVGPFTAAFLAAFLTVNTRKQGFWALLFATAIISFGISGILLYAVIAIDNALSVVGAVIQSLVNFSLLKYALTAALIIIGHTVFFGCLGGFLAGFMKERIYAKTK